MVSEVKKLEGLVNGESGGNGCESDKAGQTSPVSEYWSKEYVLVITDRKKELEAAALYLQKNLAGMVKKPRNGLELIVLAVPDVQSALNLYSENPFDVALVVAEKRGLETSGRRFKYVIEEFDHLVFTGVVDAYTKRDASAPKGAGSRVTAIEPNELAKTVALELEEMQRFRKPVSSISKEERYQLANERRMLIKRKLAEEPGYVLHGEGVQKDLSYAEGDPGMLIAHVMLPLQLGDIDTATVRWQRAKKVLAQMALEGIVTFGMDQSIGGGYVVGDLIKLGRLRNPVFGYKLTPTHKEASTFKAATDFHKELAEQNSTTQAASKRFLWTVWQMAKLNVPQIIGVLPDGKSGVVFMGYKGFTIYPIGIAQPGYPNILEELITLANQNGDLGELASQLLDATFVTAAKKVGFFRANHYAEVPLAADVVERQVYYSQREALLFRQAASLGLLELGEEQLSAIESFFSYLNSGLKLQPEGNALRLDLRVEHIGFDVEGKVNRLLPTAEDVIEGTQYNGSISPSAVDIKEVFYDVGGKKTPVPLHHEISHLKEHPLLRWDQAQAKRITAIALAAQNMFESLKRGNDALTWYDRLNWLTSVPPNSSSDMQEAAKLIPELASFGSNETLIDVYRDLEEARQILATRLPRLYVRSEKFNPSSEQARFLKHTIDTRVGHFNYYVNRALENMAAYFQEHSRLPQTQEGNYGLVRSSLERLAEARDMPAGKLITTWDGF
ncbi:hypothetical protein HYV85_04410 [Candidatus Woesearchaeota archaeon]|nr:hypothetical protein [Candidatus Woesearchaeota archaeon]